MANIRVDVKNKLLSNHSSATNSITTYITSISTMSTSTAREYSWRLNYFKDFIAKEYNNQSIDDLLVRLKNRHQDPYNLLNSYAAYMRNCNISALTLRQRIVTVKNFFEYCDVDISPRRFKLKVNSRKQLGERRKPY